MRSVGCLWLSYRKNAVCSVWFRLGETAFGTHATLKTAFKSKCRGENKHFSVFFASQIGGKFGSRLWSLVSCLQTAHMATDPEKFGHVPVYWHCTAYTTYFYHIIHKFSYLMKTAALDIYLFSPIGRWALWVLLETIVTFFFLYIWQRRDTKPSTVCTFNWFIRCRRKCK